ncbi:ABC transporter substrate-binding protein [Bacillus horti]|uniref:Raffinose/stachyose/melibiose transport system substrate-binding protein n=1 Tax=Caldalkalibacillus horti TaxID=77523 RepID=A0ABT9VZA3_9BACI|nr:extracellular solute-binding protein [Bacillus horti]MDQ0166308.1 raffinose/stachyose/melibiose transport system substrate-binding protein [Bacillus horti]
MLNKKNFVVLAMFLVLCLVAFGCSSNSEENPDTSTDTEEPGTNGGTEVGSGQAIQLTMYSWRPEDRPAYEKLIAAFQDENPNITIKFEPFQSTEYNTILTNSLVAGSGPDIIQLRPYSGAKTIADNDYLVSLDDLAGLENIPEAYLDAARGNDGSVYGIPLSINSGVIFYNKAIFDEYGIEVPETYDELVQVSQQLKDNGVIPIAQGGRAAYLLSMTHGVVGPAIYGGNDFVDKLTSGSTDLKDAAFADSVVKMQELEEFFPQHFMGLDDNDAQSLIYTEQAAMYINGDYRLATFENNAPDIEFGVIPGLATSKGEDAHVTQWVDGSYGVVKNSRNQEAALKFMEFMTSVDFGQMFSDELNRVSPVSGVQPSHPIVNQISEASAKNSTPYLMLVHYGEGSPTGKTTFEDALQGLYLGEIDLDKVLDDTQVAAERAKQE